VLAQAQRLEPVLGVDGREVRLADERRLVTGAPQLVRQGPEPLPQGERVLLGGNAFGSNPVMSATRAGTQTVEAL
jgi:hypothetical protein